jgi:proline iminopeptidase
MVGVTWRRWALALVALLVAAALVACAGEVRRHTPPFLDARGAVVPSSIAVMERMDLEGSLQSVWIRGLDTRNPVLLLLHGGPGASESALFRQFVPQLEQHFTVVYWEQRGTGRSWLPAARREALSTEQLLRDLHVLVERVTRTLGQRQVILLGHSWGTVLGVLYAARHPGRVQHYIGVAQVVNTVEGQRIEQEFVRAQAAARQDSDTLREIDGFGPPPLPVGALLRQGALCERYGGVFHGSMRTRDLLRAALQAQETSLLDVALFGLGNRFSLERLWPEYSAVDLVAQAPRLEVPVTLMLGRHDRHVPSELAERWLSLLQAPARRLVWFEQSAHNPPFEEPARFVSEVVRAGASAGAN